MAAVAFLLLLPVRCVPPFPSRRSVLRSSPQSPTIIRARSILESELESQQSCWKTEREKEEEKTFHPKSDRKREKKQRPLRSLTLSLSLSCSLLFPPSSPLFPSLSLSLLQLPGLPRRPRRLRRPRLGPDAKAYPAAARWFSHVQGSARRLLPGRRQGRLCRRRAPPLPPGAAAAAAAPAAAKAAAQGRSDSDSDSDDDDELDLFGEMTPEELAAAEAKKKVIEEAKKRGAAKAKLTKSMIVLGRQAVGRRDRPGRDGGRGE